MAPSIKISYEAIIDEAIKIVRESGIEAVNARSIAKNLNCSIHPIFRTFGTMEELKAAVFKRADEIYKERMEKGLSKGFGAFGLAYIHFARDEKNLFKFLFMSNEVKQKKLLKTLDDSPNDDKVISLISNRTGLTKAKAKEVYAGMWFMSHGIGSLLATNNSSLSDKEARNILGNTYRGLVYSLAN